MLSTATDSSGASTEKALCDPRTQPFEEIAILAFAIRKISADQLHCGLIYRVDEKAPHLVHLGWHFKLLNEEPDDSYLWGNVAELHDAEKKLIAVQASRIAENKERIPYAFVAGGAHFDNDGFLVNVTPGDGLTCATFVVRIFTDLGFNFISEETWPDHANDDWQNRIVESLRQTDYVSEEHVDFVYQQIGAKRVRPDEVVGTGSKDGWAWNYDDAQTLALAIKSDIDSILADRAA